ncbi:MAG: DUF2505 domain-containing protein [Hahellaceae bacterium]|nr:DUF2505 domain-containing protein [Hahellaceae bacterium]
MKLHVTRHFETPLLPVYERFSSEAFFHQRYAQSGITDYQIRQFGTQGDAHVIRIEFQPVLDLSYLPKAARHWVGDKQRMQFEMRWQAMSEKEFRGHFVYHSNDFPVRVSGEVQLVAQSIGCRYLADVSVACSIPVFGAFAAKAIGERTGQEMEADLNALAGYFTSA